MLQNMNIRTKILLMLALPVLGLPLFAAREIAFLAPAPRPRTTTI